MQISTNEEKIVVVKSYNVVLSQDELDLLTTLLGGVSGYDGPDGWRKILDNIWEGFYLESSYKAAYNKIFDGEVRIMNNPAIKPKGNSV